MNNLPISPALIESLGLTIVHSLWQATLLAGLLWLLSRAITEARWRYRLAYGTLLAQLAASVATFAYLYEPVTAAVLPAGTPFSLTVFVTESVAAGWSSSSLLPWVVMIWLLALLVGIVRLGWSFGRVRRMRSSVEEAVPVGLTLRVRSLAGRLGYTGKFHIALSKHVDGPALIGHFKPVLLFPLAMLSQLSPAEAEAVILHELAHLKRQDHWWNLLQCLIEVLFQYHPMVWWIGARIREEREHCCDDLVLAHGPGGLHYAKALLYFETQRATPATAVALTNNPGGLLGRIQRFLHHQQIPYQMKSRLFLLPVLALFALVATAAYSPVDRPADAPRVEDHSAVDGDAKDEATTDALRLRGGPASPTSTAPATAAPLSLSSTKYSEANVLLITAAPDTLPPGRHRMSSYRNGESIDFTVDNRKIEQLKVNGEPIPAAEYPRYRETVEQMMNGRNPDGTQHSDIDYSTPGVRIHTIRDLDHSIGDDLEESLDNIGDHFEIRFEGMEESFEGMGESFEGMGESFEGMGESFEGMGESFEGMGERIGARFEDFFSSSRSRTSTTTSSRTFFGTDSIPTEEAKIREMQRQIEQLEREKASIQRELEQQRRNLENRQTNLRSAGFGAARESQASSQDAQRASLEAQRAAMEAQRIALEAQQLSIDKNRDYESLIQQLQTEGLIPDERLKRFDLNNNELKVNGTKASPVAYDRLMELYEAKYGEPMTGEFRVKYKRN